MTLKINILKQQMEFLILILILFWFNKESQITGLSIILSICILYGLLNNIEKQKAIKVKV